MQLQPSLLYLSHVPKEGALQLVIVGKDPFPHDPTGIPFCKRDWTEQWRHNCSGGHVLRALGVNQQAASHAYQHPCHLFFDLCKAGIVFLNASYTLLKGLSGEKRLACLDSAKSINLPIIGRAKQVLYCGEAGSFYGQSGWSPNETAVIHPDIRNSWSRHSKVKEGWRACWSKGQLLEKYHLTLPEHLEAGFD